MFAFVTELLSFTDLIKKICFKQSKLPKENELFLLLRVVSKGYQDIIETLGAIVMTLGCF